MTQEIYHEDCPDWFDGEHIDEMLFCQNFLAKHPMKCVRDRLFTVLFVTRISPLDLA